LESTRMWKHKTFINCLSSAITFFESVAVLIFYLKRPRKNGWRWDRPWVVSWWSSSQSKRPRSLAGPGECLPYYYH
jgi:hypothetical protein